MTDDTPDEVAARRAESAERAAYLVDAQRRAEAQESAKAQVLVDAFVEEMTRRGVPTERLTARPWSGHGRYKTDVTGWYLRKDQSIGVDPKGGYYLLVVPSELFGRFKTTHLDPTPPPLQVGKGGRDGESIELRVLLDTRLTWPDAAR